MKTELDFATRTARQPFDHVEALNGVRKPRRSAPNRGRSESAIEASSAVAVTMIDVADCRVGPGNFTPSPSQIPDLILSHHPARAIARRLPPPGLRRGVLQFKP
jgi:hypothetical protein